MQGTERPCERAATGLREQQSEATGGGESRALAYKEEGCVRGCKVLRDKYSPQLNTKTELSSMHAAQMFRGSPASSVASRRQGSRATFNAGKRSPTPPVRVICQSASAGPVSASEILRVAADTKKPFAKDVRPPLSAEYLND